MDVLLVGGGGREHALAWKLRQSPRVNRLYCAPGNGGIAALAEIVPITADDVAGLVAFAEQKKVGLVVVGPELPLTLGLVDELAARGIRAFGPTKEGAQLEGSKAFTKELLAEAGVTTARYAQFTDAAAAHAYLDANGAPIVVKADGLAAGKGVYVCATLDEAHAAIDEMMDARVFGSAGSLVVIEDVLRGEEASFLALTDGITVVPLASSQDHKRIFDDDKGPNTGGMGAISPAPVVTADVERRVVADLQKVVAVLRGRGIVYKGILYAGLMIDGGVPSVLEFNCRFGDPECQPLMVRLQSDLVDVCEAVIDGTLDRVTLEWDPRAAACVVIAAPGYPGTVEKGGTIEGLADADRIDDCIVFQAGTKRAGDAIVTDGGRVLGVTALGATLAGARERAYQAVGRIRFPGMQYRKDIGRHAVGRTRG
ncbi:MAG: phosphoribosylamine--glycine ligase [Deltaproteobacteria bacterium]|nr:phosphoribosylamine--glycine ligase [Deltaproteobacteria bacterium]